MSIWKYISSSNDRFFFSSRNCISFMLLQDNIPFAWNYDWVYPTNHLPLIPAQRSARCCSPFWHRACFRETKTQKTILILLCLPTVCLPARVQPISSNLCGVADWQGTLLQRINTRKSVSEVLYCFLLKAALKVAYNYVPRQMYSLVF